LSHSKYKDIVFPFFGRKQNPYSVKYKKDIILVKIHSHSKDAVLDYVTEDNKNLSYFTRLADLDNRLEFEVTCRNLTELLNTKVNWGVDSQGKVFDLVNMERLPARIAKIRKFKEGLIWVNLVSYPLEISKTIDLSSLDLSVLKAVIVYVDKTWVLYNFTYENEIGNYISV